MEKRIFGIVCLLLALTVLRSEAKKPKEKPDWAKKSVRDYTDADLERLYQQWEEDDEDLPLDELPDWDPRKPQPNIDLNKIDMSNVDNIMKATKKGKTLMMFVRVNGAPSREETEQMTAIWQTGLWNNHVQADRFLLEDDRAIFLFKDGEHAFDAKDYLIQEDRVADVQLEQKTYCGVTNKKCQQEEGDKEAAKVEERKEKKKEESAKKDREHREKREAEERLRKARLAEGLPAEEDGFDWSDYDDDEVDAEGNLRKKTEL